jgi:hypothetical protein
VLNLSLTVLQHVPPLCDYKVLIDTERDAKEAYERGGDEALRKAKWPSLTQD